MGAGVTGNTLVFGLVRCTLHRCGFGLGCRLLGLVMGSIEENRYRYSIDTLAKISIVSILIYPSENPHHELPIHKLVTYFDFRTSNFLGFFEIPVSAPFPGYFHFRFFFFAFLVAIPVTIPSSDT